MAAWLQKRLKDAEALLEQADRTAQRVVVKDKDSPKTAFAQTSAGPVAGVALTFRLTQDFKHISAATLAALDRCRLGNRSHIHIQEGTSETTIWNCAHKGVTISLCTVRICVA